MVALVKKQQQCRHSYLEFLVNFVVQDLPFVQVVEAKTAELFCMMQPDSAYQLVHSVILSTELIIME